MNLLTKSRYEFITTWLPSEKAADILNQRLTRAGELFLAHFFNYDKDGLLSLRSPEEIAASLSLPTHLVAKALNEPINWGDLGITANYPCLFIEEADPSCVHFPKLVWDLYNRLGWDLCIHCEW